ncbi:murein hydrolase activator EnvC family protein [Atopomonas sediminilitoris]|uniref:murein hydrolase activator EnvC family protein n=1 Tax=Atopomonas sediminilitoris TaxID=2919919 RepID=UPI001F4E945E|nr:murein hydrolase activator EnvC [Atopomonas sediminilitoris]MCJ8168393.1 murein hydrolase activator EnvC [Atopomonas sediminilitoris]
MRLPLAALCLLLVLPVYAVEPADKAQTQRELKAAEDDIRALQKLLDKIRTEKSGLEKSLQKTEGQMGELEQQVEDIQQQMQDSERELDSLNEEKKKLLDAKSAQHQQISIQARAAFQSGRQEYLRLLLNQQQPETLSRTLAYYDYLNNARLEQLTLFNTTLTQLSNVEADIAKQQLQLEGQRGNLDLQLAKLEEVRSERKILIAKLNQNLRQQGGKLSSKQAEQKRLNQVLVSIEAELARQAKARAERLERERQAALAASTPRAAGSAPLAVSTGNGIDGPFAKARGRLPWPVNGKLLARYGSPRSGDARLKWDGVLLGAAAGSEVHAIHDGRVVFAEWLRGAGLLLILDHGGGYLSLYGYNQNLLKTPGQLVRAGETIATVGNSGGQTQPALYFSIRQQGKPSDPGQWCRTQG